MVNHSILKIYRKRVVVAKQKKIRDIIGRLLKRKVMFAYFRYINLKGETPACRLKNTIRHALTFEMSIREQTVEMKAKEVMFSFFTAQKARISLKLKLISYCEKKAKLPARLLHIIHMNRLRIKEIQQMWEEERSKLITAYKESKKK